MKMLLISIFSLITVNLIRAAEPQLDFGPLTVRDTTGWVRGSKLDCIRANGTVLTLADTNEPHTQVVFLNNSTPAPTDQDHISHFKLFVTNIRDVYPNAAISQLMIQNMEVPFVSIYDLSGDTLFWGSIHCNRNSYDVAITTHQRTRQLPIPVQHLLQSLKPRSNGATGSVTEALETSSPVPESD